MAWYVGFLFLIGGHGAGTGSRPSAIPPDSTILYLVNHGWHVGLVVARGTLSVARWPEQDDFPGAAYLEIGWGDSAFYQAPDPDLAMRLRGALVPTASVLHVVGLDRAPAQYFPRRAVVQIPLADDGADALAAYLHAAYARDATGRPIPLGPGLYGPSRFYAARGRYHLLVNCNTWAARALEAAGCPVRGRVLTARALMTDARRCGAARQP